MPIPELKQLDGKLQNSQLSIADETVRIQGNYEQDFTHGNLCIYKMAENSEHRRTSPSPLAYDRAYCDIPLPYKNINSNPTNESNWKHELT